MKLQIKLKRLGKKKVHSIDVELDCHPNTLRELIESCVGSEVQRYNQKRETATILSFLTPSEIDGQVETGKVSFAEIKNDTLAQKNKAIENALLAFTDGLFVVFVNEQEVTALDTPLKISENCEISFIRMTFLTGAYW